MIQHCVTTCGYCANSSEARNIAEIIDSITQSALEALAYPKLKLSHSIVNLTTPNLHSQICNDTVFSKICFIHFIITVSFNVYAVM